MLKYASSDRQNIKDFFGKTFFVKKLKVFKPVGSDSDTTVECVPVIHKLM